MRRVAACCFSAELLMNLKHSFFGQHPRGNECQRTVTNRASVECSLPPPMEIAFQDVRWVEATAFKETLSQADSHADRPTIVVASGQSEEDSLAPICFRCVAHRT
jgi:hypothetical protein